MAPVLGYWKIRGVGQQIRLLLEYTGIEYEDKKYTKDSNPLWSQEKFQLGLAFPNLPYYIDGNIKITQSLAILSHIARKHNMAGTTEEERAEVDMLVHQVQDMLQAYTILVYGDFETKKESYLTNLPDSLKKLSDYLADKTWSLGDKITLPDFMMYEVLDIHLEWQKDCLDKFKNLADFHKRFEELPAIKTYMASTRFIKSPINGTKAKIGNE